MNMNQVADWVLALGLIDWRGTKPAVRSVSIPFTGELLLLGLFRPIFHESPHRLIDWLPSESKPLPWPDGS